MRILQVVQVVKVVKVVQVVQVVQVVNVVQVVRVSGVVRVVQVVRGVQVVRVTRLVRVVLVINMASQYLLLIQFSRPHFFDFYKRYPHKVQPVTVKPYFLFNSQGVLQSKLSITSPMTISWPSSSTK